MEEGFPGPLVSRANPHRTPHVCRRPNSSGNLAMFAAIRLASLPGEELRGRTRAIDVLNIT